MATLISANYQQIARTVAVPAAAPPRYSAEREMWMLPPLPGEDIYLFRKTIDNSRLVPRPDPGAKRKSWSFIAWTAATILLLFVAMLPKYFDLMAGYRLESVRAEIGKRQEVIEELEVRRAELRTPANLNRLMNTLGMNRPKPWEVRVLNPAGEPQTRLARN